MKVVFITMGGLEMGMGHVSRSITLAQEISNKAEVLFISNNDEIVLAQIISAGFQVYAINEENIISRLKEIEPDVIIIDKLEVLKDFAQELKNQIKVKLVIFDNLSEANTYADVVVNAVMGANYKNKIVQINNTIYYYGLKYEILRDEFYECKKNEINSYAEVNRIMLIFGGSDPSNLTAPVLEELLKSMYQLTIDVVIGLHFEYQNELKQVIDSYPAKKDQVNIYINTKNVAELMHQSDLVIASPGLSVFEALCIGTPVIVFHHNLWQKEGSYGLVDTLDKSDIYKLPYMIKKHEFLDPREERIKILDIGAGKNDVINSIMKVK